MITLLMAFSNFSHAKNTKAENEQSCRGLMSAATMAMESRQGGTSLESMLIAIDSVKSKGEMSKPASEAFRQILIDAYDQPTYASSEYRQKAINDFAAKYYVNCMKGYGLN
ncbi:hypothetical protein [Acinetobacter ursingii]|uniref:hypothetical protein n=1 Tax=Acinetobacter ursingii TaxID=108980 RepID=UPI000E6AA488|nr:hypothetical protein [Acinetobacter ursingii]